MERHPNLSQEYLGILTAQTLSCGISYCLEKLASKSTRFGIVSSETELLIFRSVVILLLFAQQKCQPARDTFKAKNQFLCNCSVLGKLESPLTVDGSLDHSVNLALHPDDVEGI